MGLCSVVELFRLEASPMYSIDTSVYRMTHYPEVSLSYSRSLSWLSRLVFQKGLFPLPLRSVFTGWLFQYTGLDALVLALGSHLVIAPVAYIWNKSGRGSRKVNIRPFGLSSEYHFPTLIQHNQVVSGENFANQYFDLI